MKLRLFRASRYREMYSEYGKFRKPEEFLLHRQGQPHTAARFLAICLVAPVSAFFSLTIADELAILGIFSYKIEATLLISMYVSSYSTQS